MKNNKDTYPCIKVLPLWNNYVVVFFTEKNKGIFLNVIDRNYTRGQQYNYFRETAFFGINIKIWERIRDE